MALEPDCKCKVINGKSGYLKDNTSWIIGRIVRDYPNWMDREVEIKTEEVLLARLKELQIEKAREEEEMTKKEGRRQEVGKPVGTTLNGSMQMEKPSIAGLIVSIYRPSSTVQAGSVKRDLVYWVGVPIMILQLGVAAIPCGIFGDWGILLITGSGIALSVATGTLPLLLSQWKKEKWACRPKAKHPYVLTRGNGSQHAIVILGNGHGFNLEDLASGQNNTLVLTNLSTRITLFLLATLWTLLLITAAGLKANTWFLLAVGGIGILQNIYVAGASRKPENFGIPLEYETVFGNTKAMETLYEVEARYEGVGRAAQAEFFPGELREKEKIKWQGLKLLWADRKKAEEKKTIQP